MIGLIFNWPNFIVLALGLIAFKVCNDKYKETKSRALLNCIPGIFTSLGLLGRVFKIRIKIWYKK